MYPDEGAEQWDVGSDACRRLEEDVLTAIAQDNRLCRPKMHRSRDFDGGMDVGMPLTQTHADLGQSKEVTVGELKARIKRLKLKKHVENITGRQGARTLVDA